MEKAINLEGAIMTKHHHSHHSNKNHHDNHKRHSVNHDSMPAQLSRTAKVHDISIFNNITVNAPVKQDQETNEKKTDGCTSCFKSIFGALKR